MQLTRENKKFSRGVEAFTKRLESLEKENIEMASRLESLESQVALQQTRVQVVLQSQIALQQTQCMLRCRPRSSVKSLLSSSSSKSQGKFQSLLNPSGKTSLQRLVSTVMNVIYIGSILRPKVGLIRLY